MISQQHIQKLTGVFLEFKKRCKELREAAGKIVPSNREGVVIYVRTLFDGDDRLSSVFTSSAGRNLSVKAKFEHLPITRPIDADLPLVLISDDTEIDNESAIRLEKRKKTNAPTFPVIIFSDEYFMLREGESLSYVQTCDALREIAEQPVMPFRMQDLFEQREILSLYLECIVQTAVLYSLKTALEAAYEKNVSELDRIYVRYVELPNDSDMDNMLEKLSLNSELTVLARSCAGIESLIKNIRSLSDELGGFVNSLHDEYDRHIDSIVTHKSTDDSSSYSVALDLKYGMLNGYLNKLCIEAEREFSQEKLSTDLSETVSRTRSALSCEAAEISFIGTFSSGKTTLINTLLGHKHKLRTSGAHNTAVLMELFSTQDKEYYEIEYKDILKWDIIRYNSFENKTIVNTFSCDARVISIEKNGSAPTILRYQAVKGNAVRIAEIGTGHKLAVREGSLVRSRHSFIELNVDESVVRLCSFNELTYIEKLLSSRSISDIKLSTLGGEIRDITRIRNIINRLKPFYSAFKRKNAHHTIQVGKIKEIWGLGFDELKNCTFECKLSGFKSQRFVLDNAGWDTFTGNESKSIEPFCESPACYMPAKAVKVYLNSEFLKYCSITDTPGFGSITDEHDAITERYLQESGGKLVVMIAIYDHSDDMKMNDLLNKISSTFKNYRQKQMGEVCFVLNCFTTRLPFEQCKQNVKAIQDKIRAIGFTKNEIYVDNLKQVLDSNSDKRIFIEPFPSYYSFKSKCLSDFLNASMDKRYEGLQHMWDSFFHENVSWLEDRIDSLNKTLNSRDNRASELRNIIRQIESVEIDNGDSLIKEMRDRFDEYFIGFDSAFRGNRKGIFTHHRLNATIDLFEAFKKESESWESEEEELANSMEQAFSRLSFYARESEREKLDFTPSGRLIVAAFEKIHDNLVEANDNTTIFNKKKNSDYYMSMLQDTINQDKERTTSNIRQYCLTWKREFDKKKQFLLNSFRDELEKASDSKALQDDITRFGELQYRLQTFRIRHFDVIEFKS